MGVYKCPVCEGRGFVEEGFYNIGSNVYHSTSTNPTTTCRTCGGKGIVFDAEMFKGNCYNHHEGDPGYMTFQCKGTCSNCEYNDRMCYTSNPPKWKCTLNGDYHTADYRCEHWVEQQQNYLHGTSINDLSDYISLTKLNATGTEDSKISNIIKSNKCAGCTYDGECDSLECHKGIGCANYDNVSSLG